MEQEHLLNLPLPLPFWNGGNTSPIQTSPIESPLSALYRNGGVHGYFQPVADGMVRMQSPLGPAFRFSGPPSPLSSPLRDSVPSPTRIMGWPNDDRNGSTSPLRQLSPLRGHTLGTAAEVEAIFTKEGTPVLSSLQTVFPELTARQSPIGGISIAAAAGDGFTMSKIMQRNTHNSRYSKKRVRPRPESDFNFDENIVEDPNGAAPAKELPGGDTNGAGTLDVPAQSKVEGLGQSAFKLLPTSQQMDVHRQIQQQLSGAQHSTLNGSTLSNGGSLISSPTGANPLSIAQLQQVFKQIRPAGQGATSPTAHQHSVQHVPATSSMLPQQAHSGFQPPAQLSAQPSHQPLSQPMPYQPSLPTPSQQPRGSQALQNGSMMGHGAGQQGAGQQGGQSQHVGAPLHSSMGAFSQPSQPHVALNGASHPQPPAHDSFGMQPHMAPSSHSADAYDSGKQSPLGSLYAHLPHMTNAHALPARPPQQQQQQQQQQQHLGLQRMLQQQNAAHHQPPNNAEYALQQAQLSSLHKQQQQQQQQQQQRQQASPAGASNPPSPRGRAAPSRTSSSGNVPPSPQGRRVGQATRRPSRASKTPSAPLAPSVDMMTCCVQLQADAGQPASAVTKALEALAAKVKAEKSEEAKEGKERPLKRMKSEAGGEEEEDAHDDAEDAEDKLTGQSPIERHKLLAWRPPCNPKINMDVFKSKDQISHSVNVKGAKSWDEFEAAVKQLIEAAETTSPGVKVCKAQARVALTKSSFHIVPPSPSPQCLCSASCGSRGSGVAAWAPVRGSEAENEVWGRRVAYGGRGPEEEAVTEVRGGRQGHAIDLSQLVVPEDFAEVCLRKRRAAAANQDAARCAKTNGGLVLKLKRWNAKVMLHGNGRGDMWWPTSDVEKMTEAYHELCAHFREQNMIPGAASPHLDSSISRAASSGDCPPKVPPLVPAFSSSHPSHMQNPPQWSMGPTMG